MGTVSRTQRMVSDADSSSESTVAGVQPLSEVPALFQQAITLHRQNRLPEAEALYRQVLAAEPNHSGALHFLGVIFLVQEKHREAREFIERALSFCDTNPVYFNNYGAVLKLIGHLHEAKSAFGKAIALNSGYADAWSNYGHILFLLGEDSSSVEQALNKALTIVPDHPNALSHLAELRNRQGRHLESADALKEILRHRHDDVRLLSRIAECFVAALDYSEAAKFFSKALHLQPDNADISHRLGICYGECGEVQLVKTHFRSASTIKGTKTPWRWKHLWYCPVYFDQPQQIEEYWQLLDHDLDEAIAEDTVYDWKTLVYEGFTSSFHLPHHNKCCRDIKEKFTRLFEKSFPFERPELKFSLRKNGKIRIGFLVTPGHEGGFLRYTSEIIKRLNPKRFEVVIFYNETSRGGFNAVPEQGHITHVPFNWNFEETVAKIKETECDIMYFWKVGADVWNFFLPMCRLAPIQFTSWGTHGTCGVRHVDYSLSYRLAEIENAQEHYTEKLFLIDEAPAFQPRMQLPHSFTREELGLPSQGAVYYCPHRLSKYHPDYDFYLKGILEQDTTGHILILLGEGNAIANKFKERMRKNLGNSLFKRMIFIPKQHPQRYNQLMAAVTTLLDSHVYSGGITAYDSLAYGVPCVTQTGPLLVQRYPLSSYLAMGIDDAPIATNREEYIQAAVRVGTDHDYRKYLSEQIIERGDLVFERPNVVHEFELFFEKTISQMT